MVISRKKWIIVATKMYLELLELTLRNAPELKK
jgi:hypothetical protein